MDFEAKVREENTSKWSYVGDDSVTATDLNMIIIIYTRRKKGNQCFDVSSLYVLRKSTSVCCGFSLVVSDIELMSVKY